MDFGGGICQISSTLYNTVLYANLEIVERSNHTFLTSYLPGGRDATVVYGVLDFKFKNNRNYPIKISSSVEGGVATIEIYGLSLLMIMRLKLLKTRLGRFLILQNILVKLDMHLVLLFKVDQMDLFMKHIRL